VADAVLAITLFEISNDHRLILTRVGIQSPGVLEKTNFLFAIPDVRAFVV